MADDPKPDPNPGKDPKPDPAKDDGKPDKPELGDAGKKALEAERKARRDAEARLKELEDKDKSETDKLRDQVAALTKDNTDLTLSRDRLQVAIDKGLTASQAKRLQGSTIDELTADADEVIEAFPTKGATPPPTQKPVESLNGGGDPTKEPTDVQAIVDSIPPTA